MTARQPVPAGGSLHHHRKCARADHGIDPRYALAGGNPITGIEIDGHTPCVNPGDCDGYEYKGPNIGLVPSETGPEGESSSSQGSPDMSGLLEACSGALAQARCPYPNVGEAESLRHLYGEWPGPWGWGPAVYKHAQVAGIDPRFLMSILMIEVGKSENLGPIDDLFQWGQVAVDGQSAPIGPGSMYEWVRGSPPSLGWGNIQEQLFNQTKANHSNVFAGVELTDLIGNDDLAIKVTAYTLRDLQGQVSRSAPSGIRSKHSIQQLTAAAYNVGMRTLRDQYYPSGEMGPLGLSYSNAMSRRYGQTQVFCDAGVWAC